MASETSEELKRFREQWQQEVKARSKPSISTAPGPTRGAGRQTIDNAAHPGRALSPKASKTESAPDHIEEELQDYEYNDLQNRDDARRRRVADGVLPENLHEPSSALEHYERAVEKEGEGILGDSLEHYRKAYRLDAGVDRLYKKKHFPPTSLSSIPTDQNPSNAAVTVPNTAHHSLDGPPSLPIPDLIACFRSCSIIGKEPPTDVSPPPPCPISSLPSEILVNVLYHVAVSDPASFARLAQVCRRLAFLVATENRIWRDVCEGDRYGFGAMHYSWALTITGKPLPQSVADLDTQFANLSGGSGPRSLSLSATYPTFQTMFRERPRVRFNGCYISTVNYIRPGAATASQATWNSPVLIVTYYRYLRFFRDGTCISLLTTTPPSDVVHHLRKENIHAHHAGGLPSAVMNQALRGRWKMKGDPYETPEHTSEDGTIDVETEGADVDRPEPKYIYKMTLQMRTTGKAQFGTRNNKLIWLGFFSYNKVTDDWAEFALKHDRAWYWSRVLSYGNGE